MLWSEAIHDKMSHQGVRFCLPYQRYVRRMDDLDPLLTVRRRQFDARMAVR